jgi:nucleotide-binding universal stress UspA family protein
MAPKAIISYDDTVNDLDALALGRLLATAGTELILAYVRHSTEADPAREATEAAHAEGLLERGAEWLDDPYLDRHVVVSPSTSQGLCSLAAQEGADIIVSGSDYRTAAGHVAPQKSAQRLLEGGSTALALAPASYRTRLIDGIRAVGVLAAPGDDAAIATARDLAESFEARLTRDERHVDLLVVGSRPEAPHGRLMITSHAQHEIDNATCPVLAVPRGVTLRFPQLATLY